MRNGLAGDRTGRHQQHSSTFYQVFRNLRNRAGVATFGLHDLRRTAATQLERIAQGLGAEFMQHVGKGVTDLHYLNRFDQLKDALEQVPIPNCLKYGPHLLGRIVTRQRKELSAAMPRPGLDAPRGLVKEDWKFRPGQYCYRGLWFDIPGQMMPRFLRKLVKAGKPVHWKQLAAHLRDRPSIKDVRTCRRVKQCVSMLRRHIREALQLPDTWDPIPCTERGTGGAWTICMPSCADRQQEQEGGAA